MDKNNKGPQLTGEQKKNDDLFTEMLPKLKDWDGKGNAGNDAIFTMSLIRADGPNGKECKLVCRAADSIVTQMESPANQIANAIKQAFPGAMVEFIGGGAPFMGNVDVVCNCESCRAKREANKTNTNVN